MLYRFSRIEKAIFVFFDSLRGHDLLDAWQPASI